MSIIKGKRMLQVLMYHHVNSNSYTNSLETIDRHFKSLKKNCVPLFPGETICYNSICLTFDDGYYDFYYYVYPLLKKYKLKALLSISPKFILNNCNEYFNIRLSFEHNNCYKEYQKGTFCTWDEIKQMVISGHVKIASHGYSHIPLTSINIDLNKEIVESKRIIEKKLEMEIESFVYPLGKLTKKINAIVKKHYQYSFRISGACNFSWDNGIIYRINADGLTRHNNFFSFTNRTKQTIKYFLNRIRNL